MAWAKSFSMGIAALFAVYCGSSSIAAAGDLVTSEELIEQLTPKGERGLAAAGVLGPSVNLTVWFEFNSAELTPTAVKQLDNVGVALNSSHLAGYDFLLVGHTDSLGGRRYNQRLSERRAARVRNYLLDEFGVGTGRLVSLGMGEDSLLIEDDPENGENRRVELHNIGDSALKLTRGTAGGAPIIDTNTISSATSVFCLEEGSRPQFAVLEAPTTDEPIVVRRRTAPNQVMNGVWPAGAANFAWPSDWPLPEEGRYIWAIGGGGSSAARIVYLEQGLSTPHGKAVAYRALGCNAQVMAAFNEIIASSQ